MRKLKQKGPVEKSKVKAFLDFTRASLSDTANWPIKYPAHKNLLGTNYMGTFVRNVSIDLINTPSALGTYSADGSTFVIIPIIGRINGQDQESTKGIYLAENTLGFVHGQLPKNEISKDDFLKFEVQILRYNDSRNSFDYGTFNGNQVIQFRALARFDETTKQYIGTYNNFEGNKGDFVLAANKNISEVVKGLYAKNLGLTQDFFPDNKFNNVYILSEHQINNAQREKLNLKKVSLSELRESGKAESNDDDSASFLRMIMD